MQDLAALCIILIELPLNEALAVNNCVVKWQDGHQCEIQFENTSGCRINQNSLLRLTLISLLFKSIKGCRINQNRLRLTLISLLFKSIKGPTQCVIQQQTIHCKCLSNSMRYIAIDNPLQMSVWLKLLCVDCHIRTCKLTHTLYYNTITQFRSCPSPQNTYHIPYRRTGIGLEFLMIVNYKFFLRLQNISYTLILIKHVLV